MLTKIELDRGLPFINVKEMRTNAAAISYGPVLGYEIQSLRRSTIGIIRGVGHFFDENRNGQVKCQSAALRDFGALLEASMLAVEDAGIDIFVRLAAVGRMSFLNVNNKKFDLLAELSIYIF